VKTASPDSPRKPEPKSILLIGPPGGGKTTLALQFPNVYVLDCDLNLSGPENYLRQAGRPPLEFRYDQIPFDDAGNPVPVQQQWKRLIEKIILAVVDPWVKTIFLDGLTAVDEILLQHVLRTQATTTMRQQDWIPFRSAMVGLIMQIRTTGKTSIVSCHEKTETDEKGNVEAFKPAFRSKIGDFFGGFFTDMWRCQAKPGVAGKTSFWVYPQRTSRSDLKNSVLMPPEIELPAQGAFEAVNKYLKL